MKAGGQITLGRMAPLDGVAVAGDEHNLYAVLRRRPDETIAALLQRLDQAMGIAQSGGARTNEIDGSRYVLKPSSSHTDCIDAYNARLTSTRQGARIWLFPSEVRITVQACGVCHSDAIAKEGWVPGIPYPIIPGHEVAGVIDKIGEGVVGWSVGTRVGVGWFGGNCGHCELCRRGDLIDCRNLRIPGLNFDGGYADAMIVPASGLVRIPDDLASEEAAPLLCAGVTTYNSLRNSGARPGEVVAILGLGGLGHLGVQFAAKMGFRTVAIARGADKDAFAKKLGAHIYIDSAEQDAAAELAKLGGAKTILATVPDSKAASELIPGLAVRGKLIVIGVGTEPIQVNALDLIATNRTIHGHASGASIDSEDTLRFSVLAAVHPMIETMPLERAAEAYEKMMAAKARFRMVLTTGA